MPRIIAACTGVLLAGAVALTMLATLMAHGGGDALALGTAGGAQCATSGPLSGLSDAQAESARTIVATATPVGGQRSALIAVMVALAESGLTDVDHGDRDSLGLFQQRSNWGTAAQRMDLVWATTAFLTAPGLGLLAKVPDWAHLDPWVAAEKTQVSAWDGHTAQEQGLAPARDALTGEIIAPDGYGIGANYEAQYARAHSIVATVDAAAIKLHCGQVAGARPSGDPSRHGLPASYDVTTTGASPAEARAVTFALSQLDKPYVFGAVGPDAYDCSGLTLAAWAQAGVMLPHLAAAQLDSGTPVASSAGLSPGDLILAPGADGTVAAPGHVGMYIGHGLVVDAADERIGIVVQTYPDFINAGGGLSGIRHVG